VDGLSDTDNFYHVQLAGALFLLLGQNQIQEATVVSAGYSGQFGGAAGGNINYLTKSGGNEYHGNAQYDWNGRAFNANDWVRNAFDSVLLTVRRSLSSRRPTQTSPLLT
jgi:hypothetical protein